MARNRIVGRGEKHGNPGLPLATWITGNVSPAAETSVSESCLAVRNIEKIPKHVTFAAGTD